MRPATKKKKLASTVLPSGGARTAASAWSHGASEGRPAGRRTGRAWPARAFPYARSSDPAVLVVSSGRARFLSRRVSPLVACLVAVLAKLGLTSSGSLTVTPGTCVHEEIDDTYIHAWTKRSLSYVSGVDASSFSLVSWLALVVYKTSKC